MMKNHKLLFSFLAIFLVPSTSNAQEIMAFLGPTVKEKILIQQVVIG